MKTIYLYVMNTMAEWEVGNILQAISMEKMLNNGRSEFEVKMVSLDRNPVITKGGLTIVPDCTICEMDEENLAALLLPGADRWDDEKHDEILKMAKRILEDGRLVGAICGATLKLADLKLLNRYQHTSNAVEYLTHFSKHYEGSQNYIHEVAVRDRNLVTASTTGGLEWAKYILEYLEVYTSEKIDIWYTYFKTGDPTYYLQLIS